MKAERRHQLQNNELAKQLETMPEKLQRHASKIVLAVTFVLLCVFVYRYRVNTANQRINALASATATAHFGPRELRNLDAQYFPAQQLASYRTELTSQVHTAIDTILREAEGDDGAALRAAALVAKGDLNWTLANLAPLAGAATQPALALRKPEEYLKVAESAYRDVLSTYAGQKLSWVSAQFGLAAIAENRHDWPAAQTAYAAVVNDSTAPIGFQEQARRKLIIMNEIQGPVLLSAYPATAPSSQPTTDATTTSPTPVTQTSADFNSAAPSPTTLPATAPSK
ncbi:MAG: hypothetical protein H7Z14_19950 [Anaerolineae bacterium]|nr:hypothetical protein [Phycisphaerae bacterium]